MILTKKGNNETFTNRTDEKKERQKQISTDFPRSSLDGVGAYRALMGRSIFFRVTLPVFQVNR
jgi:hypothetical protein